MRLLYLLFVLLGGLTSIFGLQCYDCVWSESGTGIESDDGCSNKGNPKGIHVVTCPNEPNESAGFAKKYSKHNFTTKTSWKPACFKMEITIESNGKKVVIRECNFVGEDDSVKDSDCIKEEDTFIDVGNATVITCQCLKDKCNSAMNFKSNFFLSLVAILIYGKTFAS